LSRREPPKSVPRLAEGVDLTRVDLPYEEGLVAARVDGVSTPPEIALSVSMDLEQVAVRLASLREKGLLADGRRDPYNGYIFPLPLMQARADLDEAERKRIIYTYDQLDTWNHYELLRVRRRDDAAAVKRAFQEQVKAWHPDRWRRKELGPFGRMITQIFERVKTAYGTLSDPAARAAYDAEHAAFYVDEQDMAEMLAHQRRTERDQQRQDERSERRKRRNPVRKRIQQAREQFRQAVAHRDAGELIEALRAAQTAAAFDPKNEEYATLVENLSHEASEFRIGPVMKTGERMESLLRWDEAIECFDKAVRYAPENGQARLRLAYNLLQGGRGPDEAREHAQKAVNLLSEEAEAHFVLGLCYEMADKPKVAIREYNRALELRPNYVEAKKRLKKLRWLL